MRRYRWGVADRLLSVEDSRRGETRYSYTPTGQLERAEYPDGRERWRKSDQTGNLYPDPDMKLRRYLGGGRLEQDGEWHCEYDADGNLTERYLGTGRWLDGKKDRWRYRWNADGSLAKVVRPDKREVEFTYDALGRRLSKSFGTTVTRWVWNGNVPLHQWKQHREYSVMENRWNTDTERRDMTVWLFDEDSFVPVAMIKEGRSYSILTDQLGTPTEAYDAEGNEVWSRVLDMDGNVIEETGNKGMVPFLFQGQYYDRETGLAYNRFRYYSPKMGMYVSQDPIGLGGGILNLYGYVDDTNAWIDVFGLRGKESFPSWMKRRKGFERHHIIPYHLKDHPIIVESGININGAINMIFLPRYESNHPTKMIHRHFRIGNEHHSAYDKEIEIELYKLSTQARLEKWNPEMMRQKILQLQHKKRRQLNNRNSYKK